MTMFLKRFIVSSLIFTLFSMPAQAKHQYKEKEYQNYWCSLNNGAQEYVLPDQTRVDCLTDKYAIEVEFAPKWAESIGQSLYYASQTGRQAGIVLILEEPWQDVYFKRLQILAEKYNIMLWTMTKENLDKVQ